MPGGGFVERARGGVSCPSSRKIQKEFSENTRKGVDIYSCMCYNKHNEPREVATMNAKNTVKEIMKLRGHNNRTLAEKLGYTNQNGEALASGVSERLRGAQEMRVDTLVKFLTGLDCELIIKSKTADKREWTITLEEKES